MRVVIAEPQSLKKRFKAPAGYVLRSGSETNRRLDKPCLFANNFAA